MSSAIGLNPSVMSQITMDYNWITKHMTSLLMEKQHTVRDKSSTRHHPDYSLMDSRPNKKSVNDDTDKDTDFETLILELEC